MEWLLTLDSPTDAPLQVVYGIHGETNLEQTDRYDLHGYRGSQPVRFGNHAYKRRQLDSRGYLADCALVYLEQGGEWNDRFWNIIRRNPDYAAENWRLPDHGIWELSTQQAFRQQQGTELGDSRPHRANRRSLAAFSRCQFVADSDTSHQG